MPWALVVASMPTIGPRLALSRQATPRKRDILYMTLWPVICDEDLKDHISMLRRRPPDRTVGNVRKAINHIGFCLWTKIKKIII